MKNILSVFKRDMNALKKNPVAILIIVGLCFIPSLYAWINIKACWNTYDNTGNVPVAVVNNDIGTELYGKKLNLGDEVINELKNNKQIGWKFVTAREGDLGVIEGKYYAMVEIPEDFSKNLTSLATDNPIKPDIVYKVNTKANPVAGKITHIAEEQLVNEIKSNFVSTVNDIAFSSLNEVGEKLSKNKDAILQIKSAIISVNKNMNLILSTLGDTSSNAKNLNDYLGNIKSTLPQVTNGIASLETNTKESKNLTKYTKNIMKDSFNSLDINLGQMNSSSKRMKDLIDSLNNSIASGSLEGVNTTISIMKEEVTYISNSIDNIISFLNKVNSKSENGDIQKIVSSLNNTKSLLNNEKDKIESLNKSLQDTGKLNSSILSDLNGLNSSMDSEVNNVIRSYNKNTKVALDKICDNYIKSTEEASTLLSSSKDMISNINKLVAFAMDGTSLTEQTASELKNKFQYFSATIGEMSKKLETINNDDLSKILSVLQSKPEVMGEYISDPFNIKDEPIYKIPNYGSGMAPIYSVLAMWVGGLVLTSLLSTDIKPFEGSEKLTIREKYLGKLITFLVFGVIQGLIITIGDRFLLGVYNVNTPLFIAFGAVTSLCFCTIIYTLVSLFRNVGKAMAIILLVIQIAGSGGTYPIQVDPKFYRIVQPFFPFTYALGGVREAIAGPLISAVVLDFAMLFLFTAIFILIGVLFKEKIYKHTRKFEDKFEESGIAE